MLLIFTFLWGFTLSSLGVIPPGMINMTTVKISSKKGKSEAVNFAIGASIIVWIQAVIALLITKMLKENKYLIVYIKEIAAFIFMLLSIYFFAKGFLDRKTKYTSKQHIKNNFLLGMALSVLNMFAVPYYCGVSSALNLAGYINLDALSIFIFVMGASLGTFFILYIYSYTAQKMIKRIHVLTNNINFILGVITGASSAYTVYILF